MTILGKRRHKQTYPISFDQLGFKLTLTVYITSSLRTYQGPHLQSKASARHARGRLDDGYGSIETETTSGSSGKKCLGPDMVTLFFAISNCHQALLSKVLSHRSTIVT